MYFCPIRDQLKVPWPGDHQTDFLSISSSEPIVAMVLYLCIALQSPYILALLTYNFNKAGMYGDCNAMQVLDHGSTACTDTNNCL